MTIANEILGFSAEIVEHLRQRGETISTAESLTAGSVSAGIVTVAGASDVFVGGVTAYRDEIKISHLNVDPTLIEKHTVISEEVAIAMAKGAINSFGTTWAIATTGVAGPTPSDGYPIGVVWVAIEGPISHTIELALSGDRDSVRNAATSSAIATFARILRHRA
jgi:nicotinamide-nucleotide amidase